MSTCTRVPTQIFAAVSAAAVAAALGALAAVGAAAARCGLERLLLGPSSSGNAGSSASPALPFSLLLLPVGCSDSYASRMKRSGSRWAAGLCVQC